MKLYSRVWALLSEEIWSYRCITFRPGHFSSRISLLVTNRPTYTWKISQNPFLTLSVLNIFLFCSQCWICIYRPLLHNATNECRLLSTLAPKELTQQAWPGFSLRRSTRRRRVIMRFGYKRGRAMWEGVSLLCRKCFELFRLEVGNGIF